MCPQHCLLEPGECFRCPAPRALLPMPSPSSAALAGGDAGTVGQVWGMAGSLSAGREMVRGNFGGVRKAVRIYAM